MSGVILADKFLSRRDSVLQNQMHGAMKKYIVDSLEMIEKIQLLEEELKKAKQDLDTVCGDYNKG